MEDSKTKFVKNLESFFFETAVSEESWLIKEISPYVFDYKMLTTHSGRMNGALLIG